jgi:hypothetical protein
MPIHSGWPRNCFFELEAGFLFLLLRIFGIDIRSEVCIFEKCSFEAFQNQHSSKYKVIDHPWFIKTDRGEGLNSIDICVRHFFQKPIQQDLWTPSLRKKNILNPVPNYILHGRNLIRNLTIPFLES